MNHHRFSRRLAAVLLTVLAIPLAAQQDNTIHVTGHGEISGEPDIAHFAFAIQGQAASPEAAKRRADTIASTLVEALENLGVPMGDIRSTPVTLNPFVDSQTQRELVYFNRTTRVTLRDLELFEQVEQAALTAGVNATESVRFELANAREVYDQAIAAALEDARARAVLVARTVGVELGPVLSVTVGGQDGGPRPFMREAALAATADPNFRFGTTQVTADVDVRYTMERPLP